MATRQPTQREIAAENARAERVEGKLAQKLAYKREKGRISQEDYNTQMQGVIERREARAEAAGGEAQYQALLAQAPRNYNESRLQEYYGPGGARQYYGYDKPEPKTTTYADGVQVTVITPEQRAYEESRALYEQRQASRTTTARNFIQSTSVRQPVAARPQDAQRYTPIASTLVEGQPGIIYLDEQATRFQNSPAYQAFQERTAPRENPNPIIAAITGAPVQRANRASRADLEAASAPYPYSSGVGYSTTAGTTLLYTEPAQPETLSKLALATTQMGNRDLAKAERYGTLARIEKSYTASTRLGQARQYARRVKYEGLARGYGLLAFGDYTSAGVYQGVTRVRRNVTAAALGGGFAFVQRAAQRAATSPRAAARTVGVYGSRVIGGAGLLLGGTYAYSTLQGVRRAPTLREKGAILGGGVVEVASFGVGAKAVQTALPARPFETTGPREIKVDVRAKAKFGTKAQDLGTTVQDIAESPFLSQRQTTIRYTERFAGLRGLRGGLVKTRLTLNPEGNLRLRRVFRGGSVTATQTPGMAASNVRVYSRDKLVAEYAGPDYFRDPLRLEGFSDASARSEKITSTGVLFQQAENVGRYEYAGLLGSLEGRSVARTISRADLSATRTTESLVGIEQRFARPRAEASIRVGRKKVVRTISPGGSLRLVENLRGGKIEVSQSPFSSRSIVRILYGKREVFKGSGPNYQEFLRAEKLRRQKGRAKILGTNTVGVTLATTEVSVGDYFLVRRQARFTTENLIPEQLSMVRKKGGYQEILRVPTVLSETGSVTTTGTYEGRVRGTLGRPQRFSAALNARQGQLSFSKAEARARETFLSRVEPPSVAELRLPNVFARQRFGVTPLGLVGVGRYVVRTPTVELTPSVLGQVSGTRLSPLAATTTSTFLTPTSSIMLNQVSGTRSRTTTAQIVAETPFSNPFTPITFVPDVPPPPPPPPPTGGGFGLPLWAPPGSSMVFGRSGRRAFKYAPDLSAGIFQIRGRRPRGALTGLEVRPITLTERRKRRKR